VFDEHAVEFLPRHRRKRIATDLADQPLKAASALERREVEGVHSASELAKRFVSLAVGEQQRRETPAK
jgi:hypothetical protein